MSKTTKIAALVIILALLLLGATACSTQTAKVTGIELTGEYRNVYTIGEDLDITDMQLTITNSDNTTSVVKLADIRSEVKFINVNTNSVARQLQITLKYQNQTTTFTIDVVNPQSDENKVNVIFDTNIPNQDAETRKFEERKVLQLSKVEAPASAPDRAGYAFDGWFKDKTLKNPWNFSVDKVVLTTENTSNTVYIYAKWTPYCTVTFIKRGIDGAESLVTTRLVKKGGSLTDFPNINLTPEEEKYIFEWDYSSFGSINQDITVYTKDPVLKTYTVEFCDTINGATQVLYTINEVPYGTDLLDADTLLSTELGAQIHTLAEIQSLSPSNKINYLFSNAWDYKGVTYSAVNPQAGGPLRNVRQNMQLFAHYEIKTYTVSFNLNYETAVPPPANQVIPHNTPLGNVNVAREGYDFDGWYKDAACTRVWNFNTERVLEDRVLYAKWTKLHTIYFYAIFHGDIVSLQNKKPALDNQSLLHYQSNNGEWIDDASQIIFAGNIISEEMTNEAGGYKYNYIQSSTGSVLYTRIFVSKVTVRNGETASALPSIDKQAAVTGFTAKWSSSSFTNITADRQIYAIYTIRTYNVKFIDGENQIGSTQIIPYDGAAIAPDDLSDDNLANKAAFDEYLATVRHGYSFIGWDSLAYQKITQDTTVSATFKPNMYRVTIQVLPTSPADVREEPYNAVLTLPTPNREGYDFDGWYTTPNFAAGSQWGAQDKVTGNVSIYAKWVQIYTVTFTDGGSPTPVVIAARKIRTGGTLTDIPAVPEVVGKDGVWREDGSIPNFTNIQRDMVISATYTDKIFNVNFKNGNYNDYYYLGSVLYNAKVIPPIAPQDPLQAVPDPNATYLGYKFEGWTVAGVAGIVDFAVYQIKQDTTFIASYTRRKFTALFVDNDYDISGRVLRQVEVEYEAQAIPPANPSKEGKDFIGWSTNKNADKQPVPPEYNKITGDTVFYALYKTKVYKVNFKSIEDNTTWATIDVQHGGFAVYPSGSPTPTHTGFTFDRWDYDASQPITSNRNIFAVFAINIYTITFNSTGGSAVQPVAVKHNAYAVAPPQPTYTDMAFLGWYTNDILTIPYNFDKAVTSNLTLYAKWSPYVSGFGGINFVINSDNTAYTVASVNAEALAVKIDNFFNNKPVTAIGSNAFANNTRLQVVILPNTLQTIGANAFLGCTNLRLIDIPQTVTSIGDNAFNGCTNLASVGFASSSNLISIGNYAFLNARSLSSFVIPDKVTTIGAGAFFGCASMLNLTVPRLVSSIGESAFENCTSLKYIIFNRPSPSALGARAFDGLTLSFRIYVSDVLAYTSGVSASWQAVASRIAPSAQIVSDWYYSIITVGAHANKIRLMHYLGNDSVLTVPETLSIAGIVRTVYSLGDYLFDDKVSVFKMNSDMPLSEHTFAAASKLTRLEVSIINSLGEQREVLNSNITLIRKAYESINSLKELGISAVDTLRSLFGNVNPPANLKKVYILNDLTALPNNMFYNCLNIEEVSIPASIKTIGDYAFYGCYNLTTVTIAPASALSHIGESAFENCISLQSITIPATVNNIESNAFKATPFINNATAEFVVLGDGILYTYNGSDETVILPKSIKQINEYAFYGSSLRSFMFEDGSLLKSVGNYAFAECANLEHAVFPESMGALGEGAFFNDRKLAKVVFFFNSLAGARIYIADKTSIFTSCMQSLEIYVTTSSREKFLEPDNNWVSIIRTQLGNPAWENLRAGNLYYGEDWIFDNTASKITLIQYFGTDKNLVIPADIDLGGGQTGDVVKLANYIIPRNTKTLDLSANVDTDAKVFGAINGLTELTIRDTANNTFKIDKLYLYNMVVANTGLTKLNIGGRMSIKSILGDRLPPSHITDVSIFDGETVLADRMFESCRYIVNIELPSSLDNVGENAFGGSGWEAAYNGDFVIILRDLDGRGLLVSYKGSQKYVVIPHDVKAINRNLLDGNTTIEIISADNISNIHNGAFANAGVLSKVILKGDAPVFGSGVFSGLMAGAQLFVDADKLAIYNPASTAGIEVVPNNIVMQGDYMLEAISPSEAKLVQYLGTSATAEIPDAVGGYSIVSLGKNVLFSTVESLTFKTSDIIDQYSFGNLKKLKSVTVLDTNNIVSNRQYIYELALANTSLAKLAYNGGDCTLYYLLNNNAPPASIKTVEVIAGATQIASGMLNNCPNITNIILPGTIKTVGLFAFEKTAWFAAQPSYVVILDGYLYKYKGQEQNVTIPNTVKVIGTRAFAQTADGVNWSGNMFVKSVKFQSGSSATAILSKAFENCAVLIKIDLPSTLASIAQDAFTGTAMTVENNTLLARGDRGDALIKYSGTDSVYTLSAGINTINEGAFINNTSITSLIIPASSLLTTIGANAFKGCINLTSVKINNGGILTDVTSIFGLQYIEDIGANAFEGTPWLASINKYLFGNNRLLLAQGSNGSLVLSDANRPAGFEFTMISGNAFASTGATTLYVDMISPLTLGLGSLNGFIRVYVPTDLYSMFATAWGAYAGKLAPMHITEGTFVNTSGELIYVDKTSPTVVITDRCGVTRINDGAFAGAAATTLVITTAVPPVINGSSLNGITAIYVAPQAVDAYKAAWTAYSAYIQAYSLDDGEFLVFGGTLYQYNGNASVVYVPDGVTSIAGHAFAAATGIKFVYIPSSVNTVQPYAYMGLTNAVAGAAAATVTGWSADFAQNVLNLHTSVTTAGIGAEYIVKLGSDGGLIIRYLGNAKDIAIPAAINGTAVYGVATKAFAGNPNIIRITLPRSISYVGENSFLGCLALTVVVNSAALPAGFANGWSNGVAEYYTNGEAVLTDTDGNKYIVNSGNAVLIKAAAGKTSISLTSVQGYTIKIIAANAFAEISGLRTLRLPNTVTNLNALAFKGCEQTVLYLDALQVPVGWGAGWQQNVLAYYTDYSKAFTLNDGGASGTGYRLLLNNGSLIIVDYMGNPVNLQIPNTAQYLSVHYYITEIAPYVFNNKDTLTSVTFNAAMLKVGAYAFAGCSSLAEVGWSTGITDIGTLAFQNNAWLASQSWVTNQNKLYLYTGSGNTAIVPDNVTAIINGAFAMGKARFAVFTAEVPPAISAKSFANVTAVLVPPQYLQAYRTAWQAYAGQIYSYTEADGVLYYQNTLLRYTGSAEELEIPAVVGGYAVSEIADRAFANNTAIKKLVLPASVTAIGKSVFVGCHDLIIYLQGEAGFGTGWSGDAKHVYEGVAAGETIIDGIRYFAENGEITVIGYQNGYKELTVRSEIGGLSVTRIGDRAFAGNNINKLIIPSTIREVAFTAFEGANRLLLIVTAEAMPVGSSIWSADIGEVYVGASNLIEGGDYTIFANGSKATLLSYNGTATALQLPDTVAGKSLTGIAGYAFYNKNISSIIINAAADHNRISANAFVDTASDCVVFYRGNVDISGMAWARNAYEAYANYNPITSGSYIVIRSAGGVIIVGYTQSSVAQLNIPSTLTVGGTALAVVGIASYALDAITSDLISVTIPGSVQTVGGKAFSKTQLYTAANAYVAAAAMPYGYAAGWNAGFSDTFMDCGNTVNINGVVYLADGNNAAVIGYTGGSSLAIIEKSVTVKGFSYTVTKIASYAFAYLPNLTRIFIPDSVINVRSRIAYESGAGVVMSLQHNMVASGWPASWNNYGAQQVRLSANLVSKNDLLLLVEDGRASVVKYTGAQSTAVIPDSVLDCEVQAIEPYAFYNRTDLYRIYVPASVAAIGKLAFAGCSEAILFVGAASASPSWDYAYEGASRAYNADAKYTYYSYNSFVTRDNFRFSLSGANTAHLVDYIGSDYDVTVNMSFVYNTVTYEVTSIGVYAFAFYADIRSINLPSTVQQVYPYAFLGASRAVINLYHETMPDWEEGWQGDALRVNINATFTHTENNFNYLLTQNGEIREAAVIGHNITGAASVTIPATVVYGGLSYNVTRIADYAFYRRTALNSVVLPAAGVSSLTEIGAYAFYGCVNLETINNFGAAITNIGEGALTSTLWYQNRVAQVFVNSGGALRMYTGNETAVVFGAANSTDILGGAFGGGSAAKYVVFLDGITPNIHPNAFAVIKKVLVPASQLAMYRALWHNYADIIEAFAEYNGMLFYNNELIAIVNDSDSELEVPVSVAGHTIDTIAAYVNKTSRTTLTTLRIPGTVKTVLDNQFAYTVINYQAASRLAGYSVRMGALEEYFDYDSFFTVGGARFAIVGGKAVLIKYTGTAYEYSVPKTIAHNGVQYAVSAIGAYAFANNNIIKSVYLPSGIGSISAYAFRKADDAPSFIIYTALPQSSYAWSGNWEMPIYYNVGAVLEQGLLRFVEINGEITITQYFGEAESINIPQTINVGQAAMRVTKIGKYAFYNKASIALVTLPSTIRYIGKHAFTGTTWLANVGQFVVDNGKLLLYNGVNKEVTIAESLGIRSIVGGAFASSVATRVFITGQTPMIELYDGAMDGVKIITVPDITLDIYKDYVWNEYSPIIVGSVIKEADFGFAIDINGKATAIAYYGTASAITVPNHITIGDAAYTVTALGGGLFAGRTGLHKLTLPASIATLGSGVLDGCYNTVVYLRHEIIPGSWQAGWDKDVREVYYNIDNTFVTVGDYTVELTELTSELKIIEYNGGAAVISLSSMSYGGKYYTVTGIASNAFINKIFISTVNLPVTVRYIGANAFAGTGWANNGDSVKIVDGKLMLYTGNQTEFAINDGDGISMICGGAFASSQVVTLDIYTALPPALDDDALKGIIAVLVDADRVDDYRTLLPQYSAIIQARP